MKDNRQRLFEVMRKVNPDFMVKEADIVQGLANKLSGSGLKKANINQNTTGDTNQTLNTYGDLKIVLANVAKRQKVGKVAGIGMNLITGIVTLGQSNLIQLGLDAAYTTFGAFYTRPDNKKTGTWLDKLDVDDDFSAIVDNTIEGAFIKTIIATINAEPDDKPLEPDFNMNEKLKEFIAQHYNNRTVTGIPTTSIPVPAAPAPRTPINLAKSAPI